MAETETVQGPEAPAESQASKMSWRLGGRNRAKKRSQYHELELGELLHVKYGWNLGRRIPSSGPMLGWCDYMAAKPEPGLYNLGFFQLKPWLKVNVAYFSGIQALSLEMLEATFGMGNIQGLPVKIHKVLVAKLKGRIVVWHSLVPEDYQKVMLTEDIMSRLPLNKPQACMNILKGIPSPEKRSASGKVVLHDYYDYISYKYIPVNKLDQSNWNP